MGTRADRSEPEQALLGLRVHDRNDDPVPILVDVDALRTVDDHAADESPLAVPAANVQEVPETIPSPIPTTGEQSG